MKFKILTLISAMISVAAMAQNPVGAVFARVGDEMPDGTYRFTSGGYEVTTIASSDKDVQPASLYYGEDNADKAKVDAMAPEGTVPTGMNCFLVKTPQGYILFDTGLPEARGGLTLRRLDSLGVNPAEIKAVFLTHAHFDHIGGLVDEHGVATYPGADIYVSEIEHKASAETLAGIEKAYSGHFHTFDFGDILPFNILPINAIGHTPGHAAFRLGWLLFVGDIMHGVSLQLADPTICASYDSDRSRSIATRNTILTYAVANSLTVLCAHAPGSGVVF